MYSYQACFLPTQGKEYQYYTIHYIDLSISNKKPSTIQKNEKREWFKDLFTKKSEKTPTLTIWLTKYIGMVVLKENDWFNQV